MNPTNQPNFSPGPDERRSSNERFELLSAYMDGEVTADERRLVESWLADEPKVQQMHQRLLALKHGFGAMPTPEPVQPVEMTIDKVFEKVERRSRFRVIMGGAAAAAAAVVATVVGVTAINNGPVPQMARNSGDSLERVAPLPAEENMTAGLLVSLDEPVVVVSKTASGGKSAKGAWSEGQ
ncbi:Fis family transcriptional regulator [filamentous cyanobacterium LEGE 11480]|uniref:Fis family transcriptional regulator n=1 Tax=Romeriopsis navalis LEGE 11480 TaxID=2777977 RepID=A0A928VSC5_9CYAN|nr:Fis family transcriptional regulator [Romeriopsis navalis]MBE9031304.1 Fis family transcriptional regulator [Romeriopsis navalis LEGE 11480]